MGICLLLAFLAAPATAQQEPDEPFLARRPVKKSSPVPRTSTPLQQLVAGLRAKDPLRRVSCAVQLGARGDSRAVPALYQAMQRDAEPAVRATAATALGQLDAKKAVGGLRHAARHDRAGQVREAALAALRRVDTEYRDARRLRTVGVLFAAIGGGAGLVAGMAGTFWKANCTEDYLAGRCEEAQGVMIMGLSTMVMSLVAGFVMMHSADTRLAGYRRTGGAPKVPAVNLGVGAGSAGLSARWSF